MTAPQAQMLKNQAFLSNLIKNPEQLVKYVEVRAVPPPGSGYG